jgi:hypothetical protein
MLKNVMKFVCAVLLMKRALLSEQQGLKGGLYCRFLSFLEQFWVLILMIISTPSQLRNQAYL